MKWIPHKYQGRAKRWLTSPMRLAAALFLDPGLGKTAIALSAFLALRKKGDVRKALVFAPRRVCYEVWTQKKGGELSKWDQFKGLKVALLHGLKKGKVLAQSLEAGDVDLYVINYAGIPWLLQEKRLRSLILDGVDLAIFDEISKLKSSKSKRFKMLKPFLKLFKRRWGLTGSPVANHLLDLFGQMFVLDLGETLGRYITHFRQKYFVPSGFKGYDWQPHETTEKELYKAIRPVALSMRAEDHLDLPSMVEQNIWVNLPTKTTQQYRQVEKEMFLALDKGLITAANGGVASGKCRQIASGGVYLDNDNPDEKRKTVVMHGEKTEALADHVDELQGRPLLVGFEFHHDLERIRAKLGKKIPAIYGGTSDKETSKLVAQWNAGLLPVLCAHPASMAHGLNMQSSGSHIAWYTMPWSFELYDQFNRRVWRQGQNARGVVVSRFLARKTIDEVVSHTLMSKRQTQNQLMTALKRYKATVQT